MGALAFLAPLLAKAPSPATLKLIAGALAFVLVGIVGFIGGYRWEAKAFAEYKATAAAHELALQESYDRIGGDEAAKYLADVEHDQAETQRQLDELRYVPPIPAPPAVKAVRGHHAKPSAPVAGGPDADRTVRVLRNAFGGQGK